MSFYNRAQPSCDFTMRDMTLSVFLYLLKRQVYIVRKWLRSIPIKSGIYLTQDDKILASIKNKHKGKRCFIIGNGPSLQISDLTKMADNNDITIASNKIYLAFKETKWRPTYYTVGDLLVAENNYNKIKELDQLKLFPIFMKDIIGDSKHHNYNGEHLYFNPLSPKFQNENYYIPYFSSDALIGFYIGETVTNLNIQLAYYLGCNPIYLIGIDGSYHYPSSTTKHSVYGEVFVNFNEMNHFHKEYRQQGETWSIPKPAYHEIDYQCCRNFLEKRNVTILNASRCSYVKTFDRIDLDSIL